MNWSDAIKAMRRGQYVNRPYHGTQQLAGIVNGVPVYVGGTEAVRLAAAWTADGAPVFVFQGVESGVLFVPSDEQVKAVDWEIQP